jgi:hypothetical protein
MFTIDKRQRQGNQEENHWAFHSAPQFISLFPHASALPCKTFTIFKTGFQ